MALQSITKGCTCPLPWGRVSAKSSECYTDNVAGHMTAAKAAATSFVATKRLDDQKSFELSMCKLVSFVERHTTPGKEKRTNNYCTTGICS